MQRYEPDANARRIFFRMQLASTGAFTASLTFSAGEVKISVNGGAYANVTGTVAEVGGSGNGGGSYYYECAAADVTARGRIMIQVNKATYTVVFVEEPITSGTLVRTGTAQAGSTTSITLDSGASATNTFYDTMLVTIVGGTGAGQSGFARNYSGTTKVATFLRTFATAPDSTSVFEIWASSAQIDVVKWIGGSVAAATSGIPNVNASLWNNTTIPVPAVAGIPKVDSTYESGTIQPAPTVAGIPKVEDATTQARLTSVRAGYLDNLSGGAVALASALTTAQTDLTTLTGRLTALRAAAIDNLDATVSSRATVTALTTAQADLTTIVGRLTAARAVYLDNLSAGAVALASTALSSTTWTNARAAYLDNLSAGAVALASALTTAQTGLTAIKAKTDNLPIDPSSAATIATSFTTIASTLSTIAGYVDTEVAAIKSKTDNLPADPASASTIATSFTAVLAAITSGSGATPAEIAEAVVNYTLKGTRTVRGVLNRIDSFFTGKNRGMAQSLWSLFDPIDDAELIRAVQNPQAGTRENATVIGGD